MTAPQTLLKAWNLKAHKALGQNFLKEPTICRQIVSLAKIDETETVLEIGAGLGAMTVELAVKARQVIAVEKDRQLVPLLRAELLARRMQNVQLLQQDILSLEWEPLVRSQDKSLVVMGNLPYNISSQIIVMLIRERQYVDRAILMFQKELADRLVAGPGSKTYGRLSVMLQYYADLVRLRTIPANMFYPKPKVDSALLGIQFKLKIDPLATDEKLLARVVQAAFGQRRKTMRNALSAGLLPLDAPAAEAVLNASRIDPRRRAETLSVEEFVALTNQVQAFIESITSSQQC
jgi:16S rRNA (adenine1518-N6/adenine1519-N6)-dimethyltransferase